MSNKNGFYMLSDNCTKLLTFQKIRDKWEWIAVDERKRLWPEYTYFKKEQILSLDEEYMYDFLKKNPQYKSIEIPKSVESWPKMHLSSSCLLNIMISPTMKYLGPIFYKCIQFENNLGGRIYYTGSREEWNKLMESDSDRRMLGLDYTPYDAVVEFVDGRTFQLPDINYHVITDDYGDFVREQIRYCSYSGRVITPTSYIDSVGEKHVITGIGMLSFAYNDGIKSVIIPPEIDIICMDAFRGCKNLKEVFICEGHKEIIIEPGAFFECNGLERVHIGRIAQIKQYAFAKNNGLKIVVEADQALKDKSNIHETAFYNKGMNKKS